MPLLFGFYTNKGRILTNVLCSTLIVFGQLGLGCLPIVEIYVVCCVYPLCALWMIHYFALPLLLFPVGGDET